MGCQERARLDQEHSQAEARYEAARATLDSKVGITSRDEFLRLTHAIDEAWVALERARYLLDRHVKEHGCEQSREASSEAAAEG
jgi:hypothetical protein